MDCYRSSFETFKSNICQEVKEEGDIQFLIDTLENNRIRDCLIENGIRKHYIC